MKHCTFFRAGALVAVFVAALPQQAVSSDQWLKTTIIDFSSPVRVPGRTLPAGKYTFKLVQSPAMQLQVQIFNERQSEILATVNTSPTFRMTPPDKTIIIFYEAPVGEPEPIKAWLYPGDQYGREFIYGKSEAEMIAKTARDANAPVYAKFTPQTPPNVSPAAVVPETRPEVAAAPVVAQPEPAAPAPVPQQETAPATVAEQPASEVSTPVPDATTLPSTGSAMPMFGMVGLLSLAGALAIRLRNGGRSLD
jgi:LPXTG-motif cell wall-anchored protein